MARQPRLDAPGLVHHVMARGLNRQIIFPDDYHRKDFLSRIANALEKSPNEILAWALMPNHLHFLIRSGVHGISSFMRRILTGYAQSFNQRHGRVGYLFQGRYKSLVCEEESYLLQLLRYIHLNPVCAGIVKSVTALRDYAYTGHSVLMGRGVCEWQSSDEILGRFAKTAGPARMRYEEFLRDGVVELREVPTDLLGGGLLDALLRSSKGARREADQSLYDSRVLGESDFVSRVWEQTDARDLQRQKLKQKGKDLRMIAAGVANAHSLEVRRLFQRGRQEQVSSAKAALIYIAVEYLGKTTQEMATMTRMTISAASRARIRGGAMTEGKLWLEKLVN